MILSPLLVMECSHSLVVVVLKGLVARSSKTSWERRKSSEFWELHRNLTSLSSVIGILPVVSLGSSLVPSVGSSESSERSSEAVDSVDLSWGSSDLLLKLVPIPDEGISLPLVLPGLSLGSSNEVSPLLVVESGLLLVVVLPLVVLWLRTRNFNRPWESCESSESWEPLRSLSKLSSVVGVASVVSLCSSLVPSIVVFESP